MSSDWNEVRPSKRQLAAVSAATLSASLVHVETMRRLTEEREERPSPTREAKRNSRGSFEVPSTWGGVGYSKSTHEERMKKKGLTAFKIGGRVIYALNWRNAKRKSLRYEQNKD